MNEPAVEKALLLTIEGLVQGVGFRPFIFRMANSYNLKGWVKNTNECVEIKVQGTADNLKGFVESVKKEAPRASLVESVKSYPVAVEKYTDFRILPSRDLSDRITEISPDIAVCKDCLNDMRWQKHRIDYPFLNCTNCGPRFTIITDLPYDRKNTTMAPFSMCENCRSEYENVNDRRFHAQPVACDYCGPEYELIYDHNTITDIHKIIEHTAGMINSGKIVTVKGQGGFHMACDALNEEAVARLRLSKNREGKPFAVMFRDLDILRHYAFITPEEEEQVTSWRRPIVIFRERTKLAQSVSVGFNTVGAMLPYMPFHYLLFRKLETPVIVLTSGNISDEPIIIHNEDAKNILLPISDALLVYNRDIYNRTDDSVTMVVNSRPRIIRRSRGYVPNPVKTHLNVDGILAAGAELVNCFCVGKGRQAILSQHIGDLKNFETLEFFKESVEQFEKMFRFRPQMIACDMHPDYLSTRYALETGLERVEVQHHHAHIASAMAEHHLDEHVIGVAFDGTGFGEDNHIWGGEFLVCDLKDYDRRVHFKYIPMPGGDKVTEEPWRMAVSYLFNTYGREFKSLNLPFLQSVDPGKTGLLLDMIEKDLNCPLTSSTGRLFDAVSALLNVCRISKFHAEAPMRLESIISSGIQDDYDVQAGEVVDFGPAIMNIVDDIGHDIDPGIISARFHNTIVKVIYESVKKISEETGISKVVLSGGTFQNRYLLEKTENLLAGEGYRVYTQSIVPSNDGGIALGQLMVAAKKREPGFGY